MKENKLTNLIGQSVITLSSGKEVGYVVEGVFDEKLYKLCGFIVAEKESEDELFLPTSEIKVLGQDCIFISSQNFIKQNFYNKNNVISKKVYTKKGEFLGEIKEVILCGFKVSKFITSLGEIPVGKIYSCGGDVLFFGKKTKIKSDEKNNFSFVENNQTSEDYILETAKFQITPPAKKAIILPNKITLSPQNLLNKIATCDIFGYNNELIIKRGQIITEEKIIKAKKHNKLNFLKINAK